MPFRSRKDTRMDAFSYLAVVHGATVYTTYCESCMAWAAKAGEGRSDRDAPQILVRRLQTYILITITDKVHIRPPDL